MRVFEFHFNPKLEIDVVFDSFCYEPENIYERKMGSLYMVGLLKNVLPKNVKLVERLAKTIKDKFYRSTLFTSEKALKESLKLANEFLEDLSQRGDVSWLGNLNFTVLSLKDFKLHFAKVGDIKILVIREGKIIDIDQKVKLPEIEPYPLKVFSNTVSGKLAENDLILVMTKEIFELFQKENLLEEIAQLSPFNEKGFKEILNEKQKLFSNISGVLLAILLIKETFSGKKETIEPKTLKEFSLKEALSPVLHFFKKSKTSFTDKFSFLIKFKLKKPSISKPKVSPAKPEIKTKLKFPQLKIPKIKFIENILSFYKKKKEAFLFNKKLGLVLGLIIVLLIGFFFSQLEEKEKIKIYDKDLKEIKEKLTKAEGVLVLKETNPEVLQQANQLLQESWKKISLLSKETTGLPRNFTSQVVSLKNEISEKLYNLNKLQKIENPEVFFEFNRKIFIPHKLLVSKEGIYFFSPYTNNIFFLKNDGESKIIKTEEKIQSALSLENYILFFSKPNKLLIIPTKSVLENETEKNFLKLSLEKPYPDFYFADVSSYKKNLYFLDNKTGQIIKYPFLGESNWGSPVLWLTPKTTKAIGVKSIAIDGSIWILNENTIYEYYSGSLKRTLDFTLFPAPKDFSKIFAYFNLPYLYVLEPGQHRIVVLDKSGQIIKQFQSEKFDNLLDFGVSSDGKTIYLLNGLKVYKIEL